jgi:hypothetical protein
MLAERDLIFSSDLPAELQGARRVNAAAYDRTQTELAGLERSKDADRIASLLVRLRGRRLLSHLAS